MADYYNRETKKQELKNRVIDADELRRETDAKGKNGRKTTAVSTTSQSGGKQIQQSQNSRSNQQGGGGKRQNQQSASRLSPGANNKQRIVLAIVILVVIMVVAGLIYLSQRQFRSFSVNWAQSFTSEQEMIDTDYESYEVYSQGFVKVTRDGASYINSKGKTVWNQSYEMNAPYVSINGEYCAIADQNKTSLFIMGPNGTTGQATTTLPIAKIAVSSEGVVYALLIDKDASYITVFTKAGAPLDISIKSILSGDGLPIDLSVSPDGTELITSFAYLENGTIQNKVIFYNLDEVGQNAGTNRVVGGFADDFKGYLTGRVNFSDNTHAQAFYNGGIAFFSTKVLTSPELLNNVKIDDNIRAIAYSGNYVGAITDNTSGESEQPYRLLLYKTSGQLVYDKPVGFNYSGFTIDQGRAILFNNNGIEVYDKNGNVKYSGSVEVPVSEARISSEFTNPLTLDVLIGSTGSMESIKLK